MLLEYTTAGDPSLDFCLWPYNAAPAPESALRSLNILTRSFELCGVVDEARRVVDVLRSAIGPFTTVWGIKWLDGEMRWELYFYDYRRLERERSAARVMTALAPLIPCTAKLDEACPYFMFSIELNAAVLKRQAPLDEIHMYIGNVGSAVSSGICYSVTRQETTLENFYFFFDAERQMQEIVGKVCCSAYIDLPALDVDQILWPELRACRTLVVANKRRNDAVYFSRVGVDQLLAFLRRLAYPAALVDFVDEHRTRLAHLQYDVGLDYRTDRGAIRILKSGFYGVF